MYSIEEPSLAAIANSPDQEEAWAEAIWDRGDPSDKERELWLREAAELGIVPAMYDYADFLEVERNRPDDAEPWFAAAAEAGHSAALYQMALIHDEREESAEAEECYRKAAERGFVPAMYDLARILYSRGDPEWRGRKAATDLVGYESWEALVG